MLQIGLFKRKDAKALKSTFLENQEIRRNRGEMWALRHYRKTKKEKCEHGTLTVIMTLSFFQKSTHCQGNCHAIILVVKTASVSVKVISAQFYLYFLLPALDEDI